MKIRLMVLSCLAGIVVLSMGREYSRAGSEVGEPSLKVGVVSIWKIFQNSKRIGKYRQETMAERQRMRARLEQLEREVTTEEEGLKTLKVGSGDYLTQYKDALEKRAALQAEQKFYNEKMTSEEQRISKELYEDILRETSKVAKQKGLQLVFENSEPQLEALNPNQLEFAMGTHKLLYSEGCSDITDEVMARVDAKESEKQNAKSAKP
ncbi:MAG TPA: OmpH family outer membrane protein [Sedimentisphaerales bacterium]|nr:OmpH family outer membrane protein [Sedimentisphaerales bacterium]